MQRIMDLFMKDDVLFQNFKVLFFREMFCLPLLPLDFKETCDYQKDLSSLLIFQKRELIILLLWREICSLKASSKTETCLFSQ